MMNTEEVVSFCKHYPNVAKIEIWKPRYHDRRVLVHVLKVKKHNIIAITRSNSLNGLYYVSGKNVRKYPKTTNGVSQMYSVKIEELKPFEWYNKCYH